MVDTTSRPRPRVMVLCGWPRDRDLLGQFLAAFGADMWPSDDHDDLRRGLDADEVDLIVADSAIGFGPLGEMLALIDGRTETADLPMVLLAEAADLRDLADLTARRFNAVLLSKPVTREQLNAAVDAGLRFRTRHREARDLLRQLEMSNAELERRREESAEEARRKTRFLAAISHDIRTPVNALVLTCHLLQMISQGASDPAKIAELTGVLKTNAASLVELVNDLLDIARYDQGKLEFTETEFPLGEFLAKEVESLRPLAAQKALVLEEDVATPLAILRTDRVKLGRVVQNLVSNAIKFTDDGRVRVFARAGTAEGLVLSVQDTGVGIPEALREDIFDEFAQLRNPERDRTKGTGLGLAICRRLVTAMGGTIRVSDPPGATGSTFLVTLPPARVASDGGPRPNPDTPLGQRSDDQFGGCVLVVEDHEPSRTVMRKVLQTFGLAVDVAVNGREALCQLERARPDLVLLDLMMPEMGGLETLKIIRDRPEWRGLPVVVLTGDVGEHNDDRMAEAGATAFLSKPLDLSKLMALLNRFIPQSGAEWVDAG